MSASVNKVFIMGHLGRDVELKYDAKNRPRCTLSVATNNRWTDPSGDRQESVDWHRVVVFGEQAKLCSRYLAKGSHVHIEGRLHYRSYTDEKGEKRWVAEIIARLPLFLNRVRDDSGDVKPEHRAKLQSDLEPETDTDFDYMEA